MKTCWSLLDAGINVMTAVNIQHLETLNDSVSRSRRYPDSGNDPGWFPENGPMKW